MSCRINIKGQIQGFIVKHVNQSLEVESAKDGVIKTSNSSVEIDKAVKDLNEKFQREIAKREGKSIKYNVSEELIDAYERRDRAGQTKSKKKEDSFVSLSENFTAHKGRLISKLIKDGERLSRLRNQYEEGATEIVEILDQEAEINRLIAQLRGQIRSFNESSTVGKVAGFAKAEFERLDSLMDNFEAVHIEEAESIIDFYKSLTLDNDRENHPFHTKDEIVDDRGKILLPKKTQNLYSRLSTQAVNREVRLDFEKRKMVSDIISNDSDSNRFKDQGIDLEELIFNPEGFKDIGWVDLFLMDGQQGLFSSNPLLRQWMQNVLQSGIYEGEQWSKDLELRINAISKGMVEELEKLNQTYKLFGVKNVPIYEIFQAVDKDGFKVNGFVERFSPEYKEVYDKQLSKMKSKTKAAYLTENEEDRESELNAVFDDFREWIGRNELLMDINLIPEIAGDFKASQDYKNRITTLIGRRGYDKMVKEQQSKLALYKASLVAQENNIRDNYAVEKTQEVDEFGKERILKWKGMNDPMRTLEAFQQDSYVKDSEGNIIRNNFKFNVRIPRRNYAVRSLDGFVEVQERTGFYSQKYETIEQNENLLKFQEIIEILAEELAFMGRGGTIYDLNTTRKTWTEVLVDPDMTSLTKMSSFFKLARDSIVSTFTERDSSVLKEDEVNSSFLTSNKKEVDRKLLLEFLELKKVMKLSPVEDVPVQNLEKLPPQAIAIIARNLDVAPTVSGIRNRVPSMEGDVNVHELLRKAITHDVISQRSLNLPRVVKLMAKTAMLYKSRDTVLPILKVMKNYYNEIKKPLITGAGDFKKNKEGIPEVGGERTRAKTQMDAWFNRAVLGYYTFDIGADTRISDKGALERKKSFKEKIAFKYNQASRSKKFIGDEAHQEQQLIQITDYIESEIGKLGKEDAILAEDLLFDLKNMQDNIGGLLSIKSGVEGIFTFIRLRGLGWNLGAGVTNLVEGQYSNIINGMSGKFFPVEYMIEAMKITRGMLLTPLRISRPLAKLANVLSERWDIYQDASNEFQKANLKTRFLNFSNFAPFEITRRVERVNQAPIFIAIMKDTYLQDKEGNVSSLWDAYVEGMEQGGEIGTLAERFKTEDNVNNFEKIVALGKAQGEQFSMRNRISSTIVHFHGDYNSLRGNIATETLGGRAMFTFKRWMTMAVFQRIAPEQELLAMRTKFKGRFRSFTKSSGALQGAGIGLSVFGVPGAAIGVTIGAFLGHSSSKQSTWGVTINDMSFAHDMALNLMNLAMTMMGTPVNLLMGKEVIKPSYQAYENRGVSELDVANMKSNMAELSIILNLIVMQLLTKAAFYDDEDKRGIKMSIHNNIINKLMQLSSQAATFYDPIDIYDNLTKQNALVRFFGDVAKELKIGVQVLIGDKEPDKFYEQTGRLFLPSQLRKFTSTSKQHKPSPFDSWFYGEEKKARLETRAIRNHYRSKVKDEKEKKLIQKLEKKFKGAELDKEFNKAINKEVNKKFRPKKRKESYEALLKTYKKKEG